MARYYAGIGSRETPPGVLETMTQIAAELEPMGFTLRSGHAVGADQAFEAGTSKKQIFVPWHGYNDAQVDNRTVWNGANPATFRIAQDFHPAWDKLNYNAHRLLGRNVAILGGMFLVDPAEFVVCWMPKGKQIGGTLHSLRIAKAAGIPIFNLWDKDGLDRLVAHISG